MVLYDSSNRDSYSIDTPHTDKNNPDTDNSSEAGDIRAEIERTVGALRSRTPAMTSPIGCSTAVVPNASQHDPSGSPIRYRETITGTVEGETNNGKTGKIRPEHVNEGIKNKVRFEKEIEPRRSERIKTAEKVGKLGVWKISKGYLVV